MVVSMIQFRLELAGIESIKDKRRIVSSLKEKLQQRFRLSVAEVDELDSLDFARIGAALVSNSRRHGETILHKVIAFTEAEALGRLLDVEVFSESY
jgi:uncharacterized protein YlxP (DUF503 family)